MFGELWQKEAFGNLAYKPRTWYDLVISINKLKSPNFEGWAYEKPPIEGMQGQGCIHDHGNTLSTGGAHSRH